MGYHNQDKSADIHNSNMAGAAVLARTAKYTSSQEYLLAAKGAMTYSCSRQLSDGAWLYGEDPKNQWIDNFHTGYNLNALKCYIDYSEDTEYENNLKRGLEFYIENFFEESGRPKYYHNRVYPIDSQCASQGIDTLANFSTVDQRSLDLAKAVAYWTIHNMQDSKGFFLLSPISSWNKGQNTHAALGTSNHLYGPCIFALQNADKLNHSAKPTMITQSLPAPGEPKQ